MPLILSSVSDDLKDFLDQITPGFSFENIIKWILADDIKGELLPYLIIFIVLVIAVILFIFARKIIRNKLKTKGKGYKGNNQLGVEWYPSGWTHNLKTDTWEPPNYKKPDQKQSFEEWKTQKEKEKNEKNH